MQLVSFYSEVFEKASMQRFSFFVYVLTLMVVGQNNGCEPSKQKRMHIYGMKTRILLVIIW